MIAGIDYGSKLAGTTSICFQSPSGLLTFHSSRKGQDADKLIMDFCQKWQPSIVSIDAPLSLPGVFKNPKDYEDYFYRACDKETGAMSPMFLGGLTARAMKLASTLTAQGIFVAETYPKKVARLLQLPTSEYKGHPEFIATCTQVVLKVMGGQLSAIPTSWHEFDSLLAYTSAWRYSKGLHQVFGEPAEGLIII